jgi:uncharacterized protein (TIGR03437 family)
VSETEKVFDARFRKLLKVEAGAAESEAQGAGGVEIMPASADGYYPLGAGVRLRAVPGDSHTFLSWCGPGREQWPDAVWLSGCAAAELETDVEDAAVRFLARFTSAPVTTIATSPPGLRVYAGEKSWPAPVRFAWEPGSQHTLEALSIQFSNDPCSFHLLKGWSGGPSDEKGVVRFEAGEQARTRTANFETWHEVSTEWDWYIIAGSGRPDSCRLTTNLGDDYVPHGTELEVWPPENARWRFADWSRDGAAATLPPRIPVNDHTVLGLNFLSVWMLNPSALVHDARSQPGPVVTGQRLRVRWRGHVPEAPMSAPEGQPPPPVLGGVEVRFDRTSAKLLSVSKEEILCLVPESIPPDQSAVSICVVAGRNATLFTDTPVVRANPGICTSARNGAGDALGRPAAPGETIEISAGGLHPDEPVQVILGGFALPAEHSRDESRPGIWRVRFQLPAVFARGRTSIQLLSANLLSQPLVCLVVE